MKTPKITSAMLAFALAGFTVVGCTSQQHRTTSTRPADPNPTRTGAAHTSRGSTPAAQPARVSNASWPTRTGGGMNWWQMAYPTGNPNTSALGLEKGMPKEVRVNAPFTYEMIVTNLTDSELTDVVVDGMPGPNIRLTGSQPQGRATGEGVYQWAVGNLGPNESKTIKVNAMAAGAGSAGICASASYSKVMCATIPVVEPKLRLVKSQTTSTGSENITTCDEITYTIEVSNIGTGTVNGVKINDPLPNGMTSGGSRTLAFDAGSLAAGQSKKFTAKAKAGGPGRFENRATATAEGGLSVSSNSVAATACQPALSVTQSCTGKSYIGKTIEYKMNVCNTSNCDVRDAVLDVMAPAGSSIVSGSDGGRAAGGKMTWSLGTLAPRACKEVTMRIDPGQQGTFRSTATARGYCADAVSDSCETVVTGIPAILLEVIDVDDPINLGDHETYVITVTNQGSAPDTNIRIVCTLEPNQQHLSNDGPTPGTAQGARVVFAPLTSLPPKAKATWRVIVDNVKAGDVRFTVSMTSDQLTRPVQENESTNLYE